MFWDVFRTFADLENQLIAEERKLSDHWTLEDNIELKLFISMY